MPPRAPENDAAQAKATNDTIQRPRRGRISFGGLKESDQLDSDEVERLLDNAVTALKNQSLTEVPQLEDALEIVEGAKKTVDYVASLKKDSRYGQITKTLVLSFSRVTRNHYSSLGIFSDNEPLKQEELPAAINKLLTETKATLPSLANEDKSRSVTMKEAVDELWTKIETTFIEELDDIFHITGDHTEARSRLIINTFVMKLIRFMRRNIQQPVLLFPELQLATSKSLARVVYGNVLTILTGSVDYAIFTSFAGRLPAKNTEETAKMMADARNAQTLETLVGILKTYSMRSDLQVFLVEAKREGLDLKQLEPQVVAESIGTATKLGGGPGKPITISWCLTDGVNWIFGVIHRLPKGGDQVETHVYQTEPIEYRPVQLPKETETLKLILSLIVLWSTALPDRLLKLLRPAQKGAANTSRGGK